MSPVHTPDYELPPHLDTRTAPVLHAALAAHAGSDLTLDGGAVERVGGLCLQVIAAAEAHWQAEGGSLSLHAPSQAFVDGMDRLGATELLNRLTGEHQEETGQ